ncbi:MAG: hypothetical protein HY877_01525 [Deltaproteobacteria bacterium]|nr:hypothetical protein [Deltaproteobacteria bacterium]
MANDSPLAIGKRRDSYSDMLGKRISAEEVKRELDKKVKNLDRFSNDYTADIEPLVKNPESVKLYIHNYAEEYRRNPLETPV